MRADGVRGGAPTLGARLFLWAADSTTAELDRAIGAAQALGMDFVQSPCRLWIAWTLWPSVKCSLSIG